jgi:biotin--protein ligase
MCRFAAVNLDPLADGPAYASVIAALAQDDEKRTAFVKACLTKLGLQVNEGASLVPSLSRLHLSSQTPALVSELLASCKDIIVQEEGEEFIKGENDVFKLEKPHRWSLGSLSQALTDAASPASDSSSQNAQENKTDLPDAAATDRILDYDKIVKRLYPHEKELPNNKETPYFNHHAFFANLRMYRQERRTQSEEFGNMVMYGEVVTSTNTLLEKYYSLLIHSKSFLISVLNTFSPTP